MGSLFDNLPAAGVTKFVKAVVEEPQASAEPAAKRLKSEAAAASPPKPADLPEQPANASASGDQVSAALKKICNHIGKPNKFPKACGLFRQLLDSGTVQERHKHRVFETVRAAFSDLKRVQDPQLRREYVRLMRAVEGVVDLFSKAEKAHLEVYKIYAHVLNDLFTDDSFMFSRTTGRIKELISLLPPAEAEESAALEAALNTPWAPAGDTDDEQDPEVEPQPASPPKPAADPEADPFGLDALLEESQPSKAKPKAIKHRPSCAWSADETLAMRRQALADCLLAAKAQHKQQWAKTTVELLIEQVGTEHAARFVPGAQRQALQELVVWVQQQRVLRRQGSVADANRDLTAFDKARAMWSQATVSHRGKVGALGDHQTEAWLG